ncbi:MAG: lamin tail domain-containing protein [Kiritimatiellae bacterium]|nr:lamin tail domain-containing protein [Kiritimatiellia bacterium]
MKSLPGMCWRLVFVVLAASSISEGAPLLSRSTTWLYLKGTREASDPRSEWRTIDFDDTAWAKGQAPLGYGETDLNTTFTDMQNSYSCFFLRKTFTVSSLTPDTFLRIAVDYDDGFILWLNGERVQDENAPDDVYDRPMYDSFASGDHEGGIFETNDIPDAADYLVLGENVVAVQAFNASLDSGDCKMNVEISTIDRVADTRFSHDRGFYTSDFWVTVSTTTAGATIRYTTNGTPPTATSGSTGGTNVAVHITTTTCLRAAAYKSGHEPTNVDTHTYIFLGDVVNQPINPAGFPSYWKSTGDANSMRADYQMDPDVVNDSRYQANMQDYLKSIPTLSIVAKTSDIFGTDGFYRNGGGSGDLNEDWERAVSAELIHPDGSAGFQIDCGARPRSWTSRKRSLTLLFNSTYGPTKLRYPMFETATLHADSAVEKFDRIVLRAGANDSWQASVAGCTISTYTRDQWGRDSETAMAGIGVRGTWVHLYFNGLYWGHYNVTERPDASFTSEYRGGEKEDWYAGNHGHDSHGEISGDPARFYSMLSRANYDLSTAANYESFKEYLDVAQYADHCLARFYTGNGDWAEGREPSGYKYVNNYYVGNRNNPSGPVMYFAWDVETAWEVIHDTADGGYRGRANDGAWIKPQFKTGVAGEAHYVDGNHKWVARPLRGLARNADFRVLFSDRVYKHGYNNGALSDATAQARWDAINARIEDPMVCESARWGDLMRDQVGTEYPLFTRHGHWYAARDRIRNLMTGNAVQLRDACRNTDVNGYRLYPQIDPPTFNQHGGAIATGFRLTMSNPNSGTTIYYTVDGSDPRKAGGSRLGAAYSGPITLSKTTHVRARVYKSNGTWSAAHDATFNLTAHYSRIGITEIMYNPIGGSDYEFIEIKNTGTSPRGLSQMWLKGVSYTFAPGAELDGGQIALLVSNEALFTNRYPNAKSQATLFGVYSGRLDNGGERMALLDCDGLTVTSVRYNDKDPWPTQPDGAGYSLAVVDEIGDPDDPANWRASNLIGGTPGYDEGAYYRVFVNEVLSHTDLPQVDAVELHNAGTSSADISGWYLSDALAELKKFRIPDGTTIPAGGYLVFDEHDFNTNTNDPACFALSSHGDEVYLSAWDASDNLVYFAEQRFGGSANGVAFGRHVKTDGEEDFVAQSATNTFGAANAYPAVGPVVINEIHYHPPYGEEEFIELYNLSDSTVKLYDEGTPANTWKLSAAVNYTFPTDTELGARRYALVVATNASAFRTRYGIPAEVQIFGPYTGVLNNAGESVKLWRPDAPDPEGIPWILVDRVQYNDNSPWPESADGDGPSLERQDPAAYGNDPANWAASLTAGGTPGAANSGGLVSRAAGWKYHDRGIDLGTAWRSAGYDDGGWQDGNAPLGYADEGGYPELDTEVDYGDNPAARHITTYFRKAFTLAAAPGNVTNLTLYAKYDDGFVAYLNGQELTRGSMPTGTIGYETAATSHTASGYETFNLSSQADKLVQGLNVLAVEVHQSGPTSSDLFMDIELTHAASVGNPPAAPANLAATAASQTRVNLTWQDMSDNETGFKIDRRQSGLSAWVRVGEPAANQTSYSDTGLPAGTEFYYKVKAYNADGNSPYSAVAAATTYEGPPAPPTNLIATAVSATRIDLLWTDMSGNETGFKIERRASGGSWAPLTTVGAGVTSYADSGLPAATPFDYQVRATNAMGDSDYSNIGAATTLTLYVQFASSSSAGNENVSPANLSVTLNGASAQTVTVAYSATGGSATGSGTDYTLANGTLTFSPGQTSKNVAITIVDDDQEEGDETVVVSLSGPSNAQLGTRVTHTYTIQDNDTLFEAYNDLAWTNGQLGVRITLFGPAQSGNLVDYNTGDTLSAQLAINAGGGGAFVDRGTNALASTDAHGVFNGIVDCVGLIQYGTTDLIFTFTGLEPALRYELVLYGNRDRVDYADRYSTVVISDVAGFENESTPGVATGTTSMPGDTTTLYSGDNTANGHVARYAGIDPGSDGDFTVTVGDSDSRFYVNALMLKASRPGDNVPSVGFDSTSGSGSESTASVNLGVSLSKAWTNPVTVNYAATGGSASAGSDFTLSAGTLTFAPGQTSKSIPLQVTDDGTAESDETVVVSLSNPANASLGSAVFTYTIQDNDGPVLAFTAYNDLSWDSGQLAANITAYSAAQGGYLRDYATGQPTNVLLTVNDGGGGVYPTQGTNAAAGTDAYGLFNGIVDCSGVISYGADLTLTFSGLDPAMRYECVFYGNRDNAAYTDRMTTVRISDVTSFANTSSSGAGVSSSAMPDDSTAINNGANTDNGFVARYAQIDPGSDGAMLFTVTDSVPRFYINALRLRAFRVSGETPAVKVDKGGAWRYSRGTAEPSDPPAAWRHLPFDDSGWTAGDAPFGYGSLTYGTTLTDMRYTYTSLCLRKTFQIPCAALVRELRLWVRYDDGFALWVNGEEITRVNTPGATGSAIPFDTVASGYTDAPGEWNGTLTGTQIPHLFSGTNLLAVHVLNHEIGSSDAMLDAELTVLESSPLSAADDADQDGMPDDWEIANLNGTGEPAAGDKDGDGLANMDEYTAGTDPDDSSKLFGVSLSMSGGSLLVSFPTLAAGGTGYSGLTRLYALEERNGLIDGAWQTLGGYDAVTGDGQTRVYTNSAPGAATYYRARVWLQD